MSEIEEDLKSNTNSSITTNARSKKTSKSSINININTNTEVPHIENKWSKMLINYFSTIKSIDNSIEQIRSKLNAQNNFSSLNLFNYLDGNSKKFLTLSDFITFLKENNILFSEKNLRKLIHNFDKDNDFSLNYKEFLGIISPKKEDLNNKDISPNDKIVYKSRDNSITEEIKKIFGELISEELKFVEKCHELSQNIRKTKEFTTYEAFKEIVGEEKYINIKNLENYLKNKNLDMTDVEMNQLMFRIDTDNDGMISYEEFKNIFLPLNDIEFNEYQKGKEKDKDKEKGTISNITPNTIKNNNYYSKNYVENNYKSNLALKAFNNNLNMNYYDNLFSNENKENNKNEINIMEDYKNNINININNMDKAIYYNINENEDFQNISNLSYQDKISNNITEKIEIKNEEKDRNQKINFSVSRNEKYFSEISNLNQNQNKYKIDSNYYKNENNYLLDQTKSILGYIHKGKNKSNSINTTKININPYESKKNNDNTKSSLINLKQNINKNSGQRGKFIDTFLNFDYSKNSSKDNDKSLYGFKNKNKDNLLDFNKSNYEENKNSSYNAYYISQNNNFKKSFNNFDDNQLYDKIYNNDYKWNNDIDYGKENSKVNYILDINSYNNIIEEKNAKINRNKYIINEEIGHQDFNGINNKNNSITNYSNFMSNYNRFRLNNDNNNYHKKIKLNQNKLNVNNNFNTNYIRHNRNINQNISENLYIDSLENSIGDNKNRANFNQKFIRSSQDYVQDRINNSYKMNHSMININYQSNKEDNSSNNFYNDKPNKINHNKSCFNFSLDDNHYLIGLENKYNNEIINLNKNKTKFCSNCIEKRCPRCNCLKSKKSIFNKYDYKIKTKKDTKNKNNNINNNTNNNTNNNLNNISNNYSNNNIINNYTNNNKINNNTNNNKINNNTNTNNNANNINNNKNNINKINNNIINNNTNNNIINNNKNNINDTFNNNTNNNKVNNNINKNINNNNLNNIYNDINDNINNNKVKKNKHSSLPKYKFKKSNTFNPNYDFSVSKSNFYIENSHNNSKIKNLDVTNKKIKNNNTFRKKKVLNYNKKFNSLYNLLINFVKQDTTIEGTRQLLSTRDDSNLEDLFELFDHSSKELISSMDFIQTLKEFDLILTMDDIKFLYKKFNKNLNEYFDYEEFCEIILPKKYSTAKIISEKPNNNFFDLSDETKNIICLLFQNIIEGEKSNENFRKIIGIEEECNAFDLFNKLKRNYSIGIYKEDIANFMKKNKHRLNNKEIELLMDRFDKNKDGMIDYKEFLSEILPLN